jgi:2-polyprenyl-6-methoxyphenol hydroxylase-like FAD-dependent oxidoreductase
MSMRSNPTASGEQIPVLIVGSGLVGLSTAMFLAQHGFASVAIERLRGVSALPRAAHFHLRTLELFRAAGIENQVRSQSEREFTPEGAVVALESLAGKQIAAFIPSLNEGVETLSPSRRLFITQPGLEPILRERAEQVGAAVLDGTELIAISQDRDGVTATIRDADSGAERSLRARYLVGADGPHSKTRELLGIPFDGRGVFSNSITIYFHADVAKLMEGRNFSVMYIVNPTLSGFMRLDKDSQAGFLVVNTVGDTSKPEAANPAADTSEKRLLELLRAGIGVPNVLVKIDGVARWRSVSDLARRYGEGRAFLAGDAAHVMPPNGGFGGNTGIHDAHNLAWKLALVLKGDAGSDLLSTYDLERRPVGKFTVEQAYTRYVTRSAPYLGAKDYEPPENDLNIELGYLYHSPAIIPEAESERLHEDPRGSFGRPGSRAPHLWVEKGDKRVSTLDLFGKGFVLLAARDGAAWIAAARAVVKNFAGLSLDAFRIGDELRDPENRFAAAYGLTDSGATLARPDGFVAWRAKEIPSNPPDVLCWVLASLLARPNPRAG